MFRRFRNTDDEPIANQLRDTAEPNVLHLDGGPATPAKPAKPDKGKSAKSGKSGGKGLKWTPEDEPAELEPFEDEFDESDEEDEEDGRTAEQRRADLEAELQREAEEFGLANLSPVSLYGPNGEAVVALLDSLIDIDDDTAEAIAEAYDAVPDAERKVSRSFVRRNLRKWNLEAEVETAEQAVNDWLSSLKVDYEYEAVYADVADAARDAVAALTLEDELDDADFDTLYGPWSEVMDADEDEAAEDEPGPAPGAAKGVAGAKGAGGTAKGTAGTAKGSAGSAKGSAGADAVDAEEVGEFGPSTPLVIEFLGKLTALETAEVGELLTVWREQLRLAQEEVFAWMDGRATKYHDKPVRSDNARTREAAGPAIADAVAALVMADMLEPEDAEALYAPWAEIVSAPALPVFEDEDDDSEGD